MTCLNSIKKFIFLILVLNLFGMNAFAAAKTVAHTKVHTKTHSKKQPAKIKKTIHAKHTSAHHVKSKKHHAKTYQKIHAKHMSSVLAKQPTFALANTEHDEVMNASEEVRSESSSSIVSSIEDRLVNYVYKTVDTLHHNTYKLGGTRFDSQRGDYVLDCSSYVDHLLQKVSPNAFFSLVDSTGADKPTTQHYYDFFTGLSDYHNYYWNKVDEVSELRPGDILVFRYKNSYGYETGGHVVVVMEKPIQDSDVFFLRIADSAPSPHSEDTRHRHQSGIGIGTMLLKINPKTGEPAAYSWGINGYWNKNVNFAMARPKDFS